MQSSVGSIMWRIMNEFRKLEKHIGLTITSHQLQSLKIAYRAVYRGTRRRETVPQSSELELPERGQKT